jgi:GT2 family glycosyltransferase
MFSIIIVNWNTRELLSACLKSIDKHRGENEFEVILVDNASSDGSVEMVRECFPDVRLLVNDENVGFARANNRAIQNSRGAYLLLLNPDTEIKKGALDLLVRFMDENPQAGAAGSRLINPDGSLQMSCNPTPTLARELWRLFHLDRIKHYGIYDMRSWCLEKPRRVDILQGASLIIRREVLEQVGLLDDDYFVFSEEVDLCHRIQQSGWELYWVPQSQVIHYGGQSTKQIPEKMFLELYRGKILFFRKHHGWCTTLLYKIVLLFAALTRLALTPLAWLEKQPKRRKLFILSQRYKRLLGALSTM